MGFCSCIILMELQDIENRLFWQESIYVAFEIVFTYISDSSQCVVVPGSVASRYHGLLHAGAVPPRYSNTDDDTGAHRYACPADAHTTTSPARSC
jgi:hypothetical protein